MEVVLFGGAFDPPHLGHQQVIKHLLTNQIADQVWLVPTGVHDFDKNMSLNKHRAGMLKLLEKHLQENFKWSSRVRLEWCEFEREGVSQTYDTLKQLEKKYPQHQFTWIIGSDNLEKFHLWNDYQAILHEFGVYVYPRPGFEMKPVYEGMKPLSDAKQVKIASTAIRQRVKNHKSLSEFVLPEIENYIHEHQLYY